MTLSEAAAKLRRAAIGVMKMREKDALAAKARRPIAVFFRKQKGMVLAEMDKYQFLFSESFRKLSEESPVDFTRQNWDRLWEGIALDTTPELQHIIASASADGLAAGAVQLRRVMFDPKTTFSLANPRAVQFFSQTGGSVAKIRGIQQATGDQIKTIITNAIDNGQSYDTTAKEISGKFDDFSRDRAKTIAVTESARAYEAGNMLFSQALKDDGVQMVKHWAVSPDERVCEVCLDNDAEGFIPIDQPHRSGDQYPPAHPGDRCWEEYQEAEA